MMNIYIKNFRNKEKKSYLISPSIAQKKSILFEVIEPTQESCFNQRLNKRRIITIFTVD